MTEAYAIKVNGELSLFSIRPTAELAWQWTGANINSEPDMQKAKNHGFSCVPVTVSEKGEAGTVKEHLARNIKEFNFDATDPFTKAIAMMFSFQDAYNEKCAALARCQNEVHRLTVPNSGDEHETLEQARSDSLSEAIRSFVAKINQGEVE